MSKDKRFYGAMTGEILVNALNALNMEVDSLKREIDNMITETILLDGNTTQIKNVYEMTYEEYCEVPDRL